MFFSLQCYVILIGLTEIAFTFFDANYLLALNNMPQATLMMFYNGTPMGLGLRGPAAVRLKRKHYEKQARQLVEAKLSAGAQRESLIDDMKSFMETVEQTVFEMTGHNFIRSETLEQIAVMRGQTREGLQDEWFVTGAALLHLKAVPNDEQYGWVQFAALGHGNFQCAVR